MKILFITDKFPPEKTTVGTIVSVVVEALQKKGQSICVITTTRKKDEAGESEYKGARVFKIYSSYHERWRGSVSLYNPRVVREVKRILNEIKPDVVHAHNIHYYLSYYCLKIAKQGGAKVFLTAHDVMSFHYSKLVEFINPHDLSCPDKFNYKVTPWQQIKRFKKRYVPFRNMLIRHYLNYADKIFTVSYALKDALNQNGIQNVEAFHNGIDVSLWPGDEAPVLKLKEKYQLAGKKVILFGGRLSGAKGGHQAMAALEAVIKKIPDTVLLVIGGENDYAKQMLVAARKSGIDKDIVFTGWLSGGELRSAYYVSNIVLVPSICFDSFPTVILEAMACKKPVVATCFGGARELTLDNQTGYVVNPFNVTLMADRIGDLLSNDLKAKTFGQSGYERVKKEFNLEKNLEKLLKYYQA